MEEKIVVEIIGSIRHVDLDTKMGRIRKKGGDLISGDFTGLTNAEIFEAFKINGDVVITGTMSNKKMVVSNVRTR